ncbi:MAG: nitrilase-related carbon-nitrogen hydrolase [Candidatus Tenebribacter burtonii]|nr:nitrilase-related carbon-nitrogen hydrolase [Candidatus Tenebribacter burtonii]
MTTKSLKKYQSYIYLIIGFVFLFFFNGRWILPIAAFIAPLFLIRFLRFQKPFKGFLWIVLTGWISNIFIWKGMLPMSGLFYYFLMFMFSVTTSLIFLIDRIYTQKLKGVISTLIFPSAYVIMDFIVVSTNPSGSYGALVHTQSSLPLLQLASITGMWGITFLITWTASAINWFWDNSFKWKQIKTGLLIYSISFLTIIIFGQIRLSINNDCNTVRIASININKAEWKNRNNGWDDSTSKKVNNDFLAACDIAAASKAKIIFGTETIIHLNYDKENEFIERAKVIAKKNSIYLGLPMMIFPKAYPDVPWMNKIVWISPTGQILFTYHKAKPTPGDGSYGDGVIKYFDSPYGRIGSAICFDLDFPSLINQTSNMNIDIMLVPGNDWKDISPYHTYVASLRAIEHGFNMVRSVSQGFSASFNYKGQTLSSQDFFNTDDVILYSDVPTKGQKTIYSILGDYFAWLCIIFFVIISAFFIKYK